MFRVTLVAYTSLSVKGYCHVLYNYCNDTGNCLKLNSLAVNKFVIDCKFARQVWATTVRAFIISIICDVILY